MLTPSEVMAVFQAGGSYPIEGLPLLSDGAELDLLYEPAAGARLGMCYFNVCAAIGAHGGRAVFGWWVSERPDGQQHLNHVIWQRPSGECVEVTPMLQHQATTFSPSVCSFGRFIVDHSATMSVYRVGTSWEVVPRPSRYLRTTAESEIVQVRPSPSGFDICLMRNESPVVVSRPCRSL